MIVNFKHWGVKLVHWGQQLHHEVSKKYWRIGVLERRKRIYIFSLQNVTMMSTYHQWILTITANHNWVIILNCLWKNVIWMILRISQIRLRSPWIKFHCYCGWWMMISALKDILSLIQAYCGTQCVEVLSRICKAWWLIIMKEVFWREMCEQLHIVCYNYVVF